jgi:rhodanese-related sulfurtransferase
VTGETKDEIIHMPATGQPLPAVGEKVRIAIDWERRLKLMRMHTACHLLSVVCPFPITGAAVSEDDSRVDFDIPDPNYTKDEVTERLMELVLADHPVFIAGSPTRNLPPIRVLVKSKNVRPPLGRFRPDPAGPCIGDNGSGRQPALRRHPCGALHARSVRSTSARSRRRAARTGGLSHKVRAAAEQTKIAPNVFKARFDASRVASLEDMRGIVQNGSSQIADARSAGRFEGVDPEPRPGLRGGHMPGAKSLPFTELTRDGKLRPGEDLERAIEAAGLDLSKPIVTSCGSGVSAAIISLALETLGHKDNRLYDGSWAEWGSLPDTPVATGKG